ncbi:unnamed protein product [Rodentolepis nana]|uniref:Spc7 domain-containing protein n=1 Tax=Rodentolepis nana TaxID=102285 RepID=A0A0R3TLE1_RODNA|nr:unnamed protein product [Rodentolepis nana]
MTGGGQKKARKSALKLPSCSAEKDSAPPPKRVSFSKRIEIQEFGNLTNECYRPITSSYPVDDSVNMDESFTQNAPGPICISPNISSSGSDMDVSMNVTYDEHVISPDHTPQERRKPQATYFPSNKTVDVSMGTSSEISANMEECSIVSALEGNFNDKANNESEMESMAEVTLSCTPTRKQPPHIDVTMHSELTPKIVSTLNTKSSLIFSASSRTMEVEHVTHDDLEGGGIEEENFYEKSYSNPLEEFNLIRPTPASFDVLGSMRCRSPAPPSTPLTKIVVAAGRTLPSFSPNFATKQPPLSRSRYGGFSLSLPGKTELSAEREIQLSRSLLAGFDSFLPTFNGALKSVKIDELPVVARKRMTIEEFSNELLQIDFASVIDASAFEEELAQVIPMKLWESGELNPISTRFIRHFIEDVTTTYNLIESGRTAELHYRMGQSAKVLLTGKTQRISSLREHFFNHVCDVATKRMLSELSEPINKMEIEVQEYLASLERDVRAKQAEMKRLQEELNGWTELLDDDASFIAIRKARECTDSIKDDISQVLRERNELQQQSEVLKQTNRKSPFNGCPQHHPISYFAGLGTSLTAFGPPVPQSRVLEACRRLQVLQYPLNAYTFCLAVEENSYIITTFYGLITFRVDCAPSSNSLWSASNLEITNLDVAFRRSENHFDSSDSCSLDPALMKTTNSVGEYAFRRMKENWQLVADNLLGRKFEDALDFFEYVLHSYALLATCLHGLCSLGILITLETSWHSISIPDLYETKSRCDPWRLSKNFYVLGKALSLEISRDSEPFRLSGYVAPKNSTNLLKTEFKIYSPHDLFKPEASKSIEVKDLFGNSRLDLLKSPTISPKDTVVDIHEKLISIAKALK